MPSGWLSSGPVLDQRTDSGLARSIRFTHLTPEDAYAYVALPGSPAGCDELLREKDLLDEGVAAVFRWAGAEVELVGLCFHVRKFTPVQAVHWLTERRFAPLLYRANSG